MKANTIKELFDQIQIDADNQIIFNRELYENEANRIIESLLKQQRNDDIRAFGRALEIWLREDTAIYGKTIGKAIGGKKIEERIMEQLNAPEPEIK